MPNLYPDQSELIEKLRDAVRQGYKKILLQSATGSGKTVISSAITKSAFANNKIVWFIVPRNLLVKQTSKQFYKYNIQHNKITAGSNESLAYNVHIVSLQTLQRRWHKIKRWADIIIWDECHINYDAQLQLLKMMPDKTILIGQTATPQRTDNRGLKNIYQVMVCGESIPWLCENKRLKNIRYFAPHIEGLNDIKKVGLELDKKESDEFYSNNNIYGDAIKYYKKYGQGRTALGFFRSVDSAHEGAKKFRDAGFSFYAIDGGMKDSEIDKYVNLLDTGKIQGICSCELVNFGFDVRRINYIFACRWTGSLALYMQMGGRGFRTFEDQEDFIFFDHANLIETHFDSRYPGVPIFYIPDIDWNFNSENKKKLEKPELSLKLCPALDFMYCQKPNCMNCEHNTGQLKDIRKPLKHIDCELIEKTPDKLLFKDIRSDVELFRRENNLEGLISVSNKMGYSGLWVYRQLAGNSRDMDLLKKIGALKGYKSGWAYTVGKTI